MQVVIIRHAHAEWPNYHGGDFERPLTERGIAEARSCARAIFNAGHRPALLLASPALRTRQTAEILAEELQLAEGALHYIDDLYNASAHTLEAELRKVAGAGSLVMLVAHNPGVSNLARNLAGDPGAPACNTAEWRLLSL